MQEDNKCHIVFRNLGSYYLTYTPINPNGSNETINKFYGETLNLEDTVYVYGFQAFYTSESGLSEFKLANKTSPWIIDEINLSADVTYLLKKDVNEVLNISSENIAKTNQAPIYFESNATLMVNEMGNYISKYYYFSSNEEFDEASALPSAIENYSASPISKTGIYLVELSYTFGENILSEQKQFFLFKITNDAPKVDIYTLNEDGSQAVINNDEYTYKDVYITKTALDVFDSKSTLMVYKDGSFNGSYDAGVEVVEKNLGLFSETGRYKVELKYGNSNKKGFVSYFVIDKEPISEIAIN